LQIKTYYLVEASLWE